MIWLCDVLDFIFLCIGWVSAQISCFPTYHWSRGSPDVWWCVGLRFVYAFYFLCGDTFDTWDKCHLHVEWRITELVWRLTSYNIQVCTWTYVSRSLIFLKNDVMIMPISSFDRLISERVTLSCQIFVTFLALASRTSCIFFTSTECIDWIQYILNNDTHHCYFLFMLLLHLCMMIPKYFLWIVS